MASSQKKRINGKYGHRDSGGFIALPFAVLNSPNYLKLSANARSLLLEVALQCRAYNNGKLLLSRAHLAKRGWKSSDMIFKGKNELLDGGFIYQTVMGHRPNKASWYAVTWLALDFHKEYDEGASQGFKRGSYSGTTGINIKSLNPPSGAVTKKLEPPCGLEDVQRRPPYGTVQEQKAA